MNKPTIFLDLDGVIRENNKSLGTGDLPDDVGSTATDLKQAWDDGKIPKYYYITQSSDVIFRPLALEALRRLHEAGLDCYVITNQEVVGVGIIDCIALGYIFDHMDSVISEHGGKIKDWFFCEHLPGENCICRKPSPTLLNYAKSVHRFDRNNCIMIGDNVTDIEAGIKFGCKATIQILLDKHKEQAIYGGDALCGKARSLMDAVIMIGRWEEIKSLEYPVSY